MTAACRAPQVDYDLHDTTSGSAVFPEEAAIFNRAAFQHQGKAETGGWGAAAAGTLTDYCTFYGVFCDKNGNVAGLLLQSNNLTGVLPAALGSLSHLWHLNLRNNTGLRGAVPPLPASLEYLDLSQNRLTVDASLYSSLTQACVFRVGPAWTRTACTHAMTH